MFAGVPQVAASQSLDEVAWRIRRLTESLGQSRAANAFKVEREDGR
jgi:hypothetical protein